MKNEQEQEKVSVIRDGLGRSVVIISDIKFKGDQCEGESQCCDGAAFTHSVCGKQAVATEL